MNHQSSPAANVTSVVTPSAIGMATRWWWTATISGPDVDRHGGYPASKDVRLSYRIRKLEDGKSLEILTTVNDPKMYARPWSFVRSFAWTPNAWMLGEYDCEQQVGESGGATRYGLSEDEQAPQ